MGLKKEEEERIERERTREYLKLEEDLENQMVEARKISVQARIQEELKRLKEQEEAWQIKVAEEEKLRKERRKQKDKMKKKIAEEIEKLKKFEEEQAAKLKAQSDAETKKKKLEEEAKTKEAKPAPIPSA